MKQRRKTVFFSIEISARELDSKCLLALEMVKRGVRAYIGSTRALKRLNGQTSSCIFFHKSAWNTQKVDRFTEKLGAKFVFLDEEMGPSLPSSEVKPLLAARFRNVSSKQYKDVFALGVLHKKEMEALPQFKGIRVHAMGWPRLDLFREEFQQLNLAEARKIKEEFGSFFLLVSSFGTISESTRDDFKVIREKCGLTDHRLVDFKYEEFKNCLELIHELSQKLGDDEKLIIRPHTSESIGQWKKHIRGYDNVFVEHRGDVTAWLMASKGTIQFGSTVAIQAALMGIPSAQLLTATLPGITDSPPYQVTEQSRSAEELLVSLRMGQKVNPRTLREKARKRLDGLVANLDGPLASEVMADYLSELDVTPQAPVRFNFFDRTIFSLKEKVNYVKYITKKNFSKESGSITRMRFDKIPNGLTENDIRARLQNLAKIRGYAAHKICCRQIANNLVEIEMK